MRIIPPFNSFEDGQPIVPVRTETSAINGYRKNHYGICFHASLVQPEDALDSILKAIKSNRLTPPRSIRTNIIDLWYFEQ